MAEAERTWRQRHAHESNAIPYGTFGTATYRESAQQWTFLRNGSVERNLDEENGSDGDTVSLLRILSDPETVVEPTCHDEAIRQTAADSTLYSQYSELAAASSTIQAILQSETDAISTTTAGHIVSFGHAVWLGVDGVESGNLKVPISAHIGGPGRDLLHIACVGRQSFEYTSEYGISSSIKIPSLLGDPHTIWAGSMPIQQVIFSQPDLEGRSGTFLAVREACQTTIFEPLLQRYAGANTSFTDRSSLKPNRILSLPRSHTGGQDHADVCFHPHDQRKLAVVDAEGNWSIWHIQGRRTRTARVLYKIVLQTSNKIFSWEHRRRPEGVELYFDGWHKVLWMSCDRNDVDRVLVCNRQDAKLFKVMTTSNDAIRSIDVRLDTRKEDAYILDVRQGLTPNLCFILTTSRLLLFDFAQKDWKDRGTVHGPALLFAWQHFQKTSDLSLSMATVELQDAMLVTLYSRDPRIMQLYLLHFHYIDGELSVTVDDPSVVKLPKALPTSPVASLSLATLETSQNDHHREGQQQRLIQFIIQYEDLSIFKVTMELHRYRLSQPDKQKSTLRLPPDRNKERKSKRYVDEMDDEDDLAGFIVDDDEVEKSEYEEDPVDIEQRALSTAADLNELPDETSKILRKIAGGKYTSDVMMNVLHEISNSPPTARRDVLEAIEAFDQALQNPSASNDMPQAQTLSDLFDKDTRIEDIETDSATLDRALHMISSAVEDRIRISAPDKHGFQSLLQTYEDLFETYVNSLNPAVPDRFRVQRERQIRDIALDLYLSSRTVRALPTSNSVPILDNDAHPLLLPDSDPITQQDSPSRKIPTQISATASQPLPRHPDSGPSPSPSPPSPRPTSSPLDAAIARLKSYTTIAYHPRPAPTPVQTPTSISNHDNHNHNHNHISTLLSHLPASAAADPTTYDWRATDLQTQLAASATATPDKNSKSKSTSDRRATRIGRTRRGDDVRSRGEVSTLIAGIGGDGDGAQPRAGVGMGMGQIMSEVHVLESSQGGPGPGPAMTMMMTSTQPVSGAFANRDRGKQKKKKKRVAGF
ncbi:hypothetical protein LTR70_005605 [Exophiala xenobiotica]|uniref:RNA polymerase I-specific transcription initiation factor RRN6-like protein n=1 Tax=Lithohypha guttulata TaxID=1690604 RepID=A0ABR0K9F0_9EURO|nr:hypothetical protein LTR24_005327 [Lithohypha guttulata]KAK5318022.1 hypothetical protein LTR70_005605 [Exophiala xenobiotica]